ncbi:DUF302 domain-containing protein [Leifsonia shinshuensis]|uniref:DUF302 domain-containing protein n=1 Tax=Leifsonia shinshuensis TaxID=150026 RepID=UPI0028605A25|nr:DUF302 domain-containing protein [Leifsonia shinshuensis]MDR6972909.1 uncharacterized protein (DUF302 family) [Leifsonia shinshuensis]
MANVTTITVPVERIEFISRKPFQQVLDGVHRGLGHPDFGQFVRHIAQLNDWEEFKAAVAAEAGPSGLMVFLELDLGGVVGKDPQAIGFREVRIIAGNPVTMESMVRTSPAAGAFAPVTILIFESPDGVHVRYDTLTSAVASELSAEALVHARKLDTSVTELLRSAV